MEAVESLVKALGAVKAAEDRGADFDRVKRDIRASLDSVFVPLINPLY